MFKRIGIMGLALIAVVAVSGLALSSASAEAPLGCYRVDLPKTGNFKDAACKEEVANLTGEWVLAIPLRPLPGTDTLWCAKLDPKSEKTGLFEDEKCEHALSNGKFTDIKYVLPTIHTALTGENYPILLAGEAKRATEGEIALKTNASKLPATLFSILLTAQELTSLGTYHLTFTGVHENLEPTVTCETTGSGAGVVLLLGEWHLVFTSRSPLRIGLLILFSKVVIKCSDGLETTVEAPSLVGSEPVTESSGDSTQLEGYSHCVGIGGKAELHSYFASLEEPEIIAEEQLLTANISGTGKGPGCEEVSGTTLVKVESGSTASHFTILY